MRLSSILISQMLVLGLVPTACGQSKNIERRASAKASEVQDTIDGNVELVKSKVVTLFREKYENRLDNKDDKFSSFIPSTKEDQEITFPSDLQIKAWLVENKHLTDYVRLTEEDRKYDVYLCYFGTEYWYSEYYWDNKPAKFQCNFIVHLEPDGNNRTKIRIYQYQPQVWVGTKFGWQHYGLGSSNDTRWVEPTVQDSLELLALIREKLKS